MAKRTALRRIGVVAFLMAAATMMIGAPVFAKGGGETTLGNNLSTPTIFVPSATGAPALRIACPATHQAPGADGVAPSTDPLYSGYWLQKTTATWTADCAEAATASVTAQWGANLTDSPTLAAGKPIRVEVSLLDPAATGMTGYVVNNLTPELPDREAVYGTKPDLAFVTGDANAPLARAWTAGTYLKIEQKQADNTWKSIYYQPMIAEINSTGSIVYGYNWGSKGRANTPAPGDYRLTFTVPATGGVTITGVVPGAVNNPSYTPTSTTIEFTLSGSGRGGGGGGGGGGH